MNNAAKQCETTRTNSFPVPAFRLTVGTHATSSKPRGGKNCRMVAQEIEQHRPTLTVHPPCNGMQLPARSLKGYQLRRMQKEAVNSKPKNRRASTRSHLETISETVAGRGSDEELDSLPILISMTRRINDSTATTKPSNPRTEPKRRYRTLLEMN